MVRKDFLGKLLFMFLEFYIKVFYILIFRKKGAIIFIGEFETFLTEHNLMQKNKTKGEFNMKASRSKLIARAGLIAAIYTVLSYVSAPLTFFGFQFRLSEAMTVLPVFFPEAVIGLFVGCIVSNILTGAVFFDILFGSVATLIGAALAYFMRKLPNGLLWLCTLPAIISNTLIIPPVLVAFYGSGESYAFLTLTVFVGEAVTAGGLGTLLLYQLKKVFSPSDK